MRAVDLSTGGLLALLATTGCAPVLYGEDAASPPGGASPYAEVTRAPAPGPLLPLEDARGRVVVVRVPGCCPGPIAVSFVCTAAAPPRPARQAYRASPYEDEAPVSLPPKPSPYEDPVDVPPSPYGYD